MQIDLFDTLDFTTVNDLLEIIDPVIFSRGGVLSPNGLLSTEIFGVSLRERKENYAYVDLHDYFLHPFIYKLLKRINRNFESIVHGNKSFIIKDGELVEDDTGETGLNFLYNNWEKINFKKNESRGRNERIDVLNAYKKNEIFVNRWVIIPAFYRDVNLSSIDKGKLSHHEINDKYSKLIRLAEMIKSSNDFNFVLNTTRANIQVTLVEIYDLLKSKLEKKQGMIRRSLLGKSITYGSRSVITAPTFKAKVPEELEVDFYHTGIPLAQCCSLFTPFIISWVKNFFQREFERSGNDYVIKDKTGTLKTVKLKEPELYFNEEMIKKEIDNFIFSYSNRFVPIKLPTEDNSDLYFSFVGRVYDKSKPETESPIIGRPATWADILYQAAYEITSDKHVYITRYPLTDYFGTFPNRITVLSTHTTVPMFINNKVYSSYPKIDLKMPQSEIAVAFIDTVTMSNLYLDGLGGKIIATMHSNMYW